MTYQENLVAYIGFEMTVPTYQCLDPENRKIIAVSNIIIFAFHLDLNIGHIIIGRSFGDSLKSLADLSYLTHKQHTFKDEKTIIQLKDCALVV